MLEVKFIRKYLGHYFTTSTQIEKRRNAKCTINCL